MTAVNGKRHHRLRILQYDRMIVRRLNQQIASLRVIRAISQSDMDNDPIHLVGQRSI
jgi:hypothetical protein